jgi:gamma-glutamyltranspeptidase/glutathione hydrolase
LSADPHATVNAKADRTRDPATAATVRALASLSLAVLLASCAMAPEPRTPADKAPTIAVPGEAPRPQIAATAHPLATKAALAMLDKGGTPIDAAIAAQMVLGLVEPQSSGVGGGTVVMHWDAATRKLTSFDGLAKAPSVVSGRLGAVNPGGRANPAALRGGYSVGVPGTLPVLKVVHERYGRLSWEALFEPAITAAEQGFPLAPYLHRVLSRPNAASNHPEMVPLYFGPDGKVLPVGTLLRNPDYARTLRRVAKKGPEGLFADGGAARIVAAARRGYRASAMSEDDLRAYRAIEREPLCAPYLVYTVCTMGPPSFGGVRMLQIVQVAERLGNGRHDLGDPAVAHVFLEASRLAMADRDQFGDDPDRRPVPARELVSAAHVAKQAAAIDAARTRRLAPGTVSDTGAGAARSSGEMTSQMAIVDAAGNAVSITTTINLDFGSRLMVDGFVLNNAMNLFTDLPTPGPNRIGPGARGVTSMAPTIAFDREGNPVLVGGAAGGAVIPEYVAAAVIDMLANGHTPSQALAAGHLSAAASPGKVRLESRTPAARLAPALRAMGHDVEEGILLSGLAFLKRTPAGWIGAADPRRDGTAQ